MNWRCGNPRVRFWNGTAIPCWKRRRGGRAPALAGPSERRGPAADRLGHARSPGGQELGRRLKAERPDLKVIYASGYSADIAGQDFQLQPGEAFVQKPFAKEHLLETIRRCLDG